MLHKHCRNDRLNFQFTRDRLSADKDVFANVSISVLNRPVVLNWCICGTWHPIVRS